MSSLLFLPSAARSTLLSTLACMLCAFGTTCLVLDAHAQAQPAKPAAKPAASKGGKAPAKAEPTLAELGTPKWVVIDGFVPPNIPVSAVPAGSDFRANVDATINANGTIKRIYTITVTPPNPVIESAVAAVAKQWVFTPPTQSCVPTEGFVQGSLKIDLEDGKVRIFARRPPPSEVAEAIYKDAPIISNRLAFSQSIQRQYPQAALKARVEARVYMIATIEAGSGNMVSADISHVLSDRPQFTQAFTEAAQRAIQVLKFDPQRNSRGQMKSCIALPFTVANMVK